MTGAAGPRRGRAGGRGRPGAGGLGRSRGAAWRPRDRPTGGQHVDSAPDRTRRSRRRDGDGDAGRAAGPRRRTNRRASRPDVSDPDTSGHRLRRPGAPPCRASLTLTAADWGDATRCSPTGAASISGRRPARRVRERSAVREPTPTASPGGTGSTPWSRERAYESVTRVRAGPTPPRSWRTCRPGRHVRAPIQAPGGTSLADPRVRVSPATRACSSTRRGPRRRLPGISSRC